MKYDSDSYVKKMNTYAGLNQMQLPEGTLLWEARYKVVDIIDFCREIMFLPLTLQCEFGIIIKRN